MKTASHIRYEVEWPTSPDIDAMEFEFAHCATLSKARALARRKAKAAPIGVAYITREIYSGNGDPLWAPDHEWDRDETLREEVSI